MTEPVTPAAAPATPANEPAAAAPAAPATPAAAPAAAVTPKAEPVEPAKPAAPEKYDLKLPEGSPLDPSRVEKIAALAKEQGLSNEAAQALLDSEHKVITEHTEAQLDVLVKKDEAWVAALQADPDFGRDKFGENVEHAKRFLDKFGDAELKAQLDQSRLGNFPPLVKAFARAGRLIAADHLVLPDGPAVKKLSLEERIYAAEGKPNT
jgi:hypothetical protein